MLCSEPGAASSSFCWPLTHREQFSASVFHQVIYRIQSTCPRVIRSEFSVNQCKIRWVRGKIGKSLCIQAARVNGILQYTGVKPMCESFSLLLLFLPAADLPAPLPPAAGSAAAEAKLQGQQIFSSQRQVSLTPPPPPHLPLYPPFSACFLSLSDVDITKPQQSRNKNSFSFQNQF